MILNTHDLETLCRLAIKAAKSAGALIRDYSQKSIRVHNKNAGSTKASQIVTEVDFKSQELILNLLQPSITRYDLGLLTEELPDTKDRLHKDYFWCIDPLDGTLAFTESTPGYAVSIALVTKNGQPQLGVVYDPVTQTLYHAIKNKGAYKNDKTWQLPEPKHERPLQFYFNRSFKALDSFSSVLKALKKIAISLSAQGINTNTSSGAVMNACYALENTPSCYFAFPKNTEGGGSLWDYAATACIYLELGASVSDIYGVPLDLNNQESTFMHRKGVLYASQHSLSKKIQKLYQKLKAPL
ncbi:3'(2'),5'-bisphosphate nucleotidase CysQ family protein [Algibacter mikhailovii]|uniref:3'(2'),5'-bisphosphate nucleotidase CysQ n=1 Tax=Algibacter mikhailovii TaxID=425498 RepID=A0A918VFZ3_9FLAO|nr:inositol monophosphatase family protein [Algibacter mikhailovii]GGZ93684.1 3'(2'),5'-bisphosphate nucleotidase CysQ [Algibacter mikhailovii]